MKKIRPCRSYSRIEQAVIRFLVEPRCLCIPGSSHIEIHAAEGNETVHGGAVAYMPPGLAGVDETCGRSNKVWSGAAKPNLS